MTSKPSDFSQTPFSSGPVYFISDLHLCPSMPKTAAAFEHFMQHTTRDASAVFILGDLFEFWVGDGMVEQPFIKRMLSCMRGLNITVPSHPDTSAKNPATSTRALYILHGNRDFLLGPRFAALAGAQLLPDPFIFEAFGQRIALSHGDHLCTADHSYQRFRRIVRNPLVQRFFLAWPLSWRLGLANWIRAQSDKARHTSHPHPKHLPSATSTQKCSPAVDPKDVTPQAVAALFAQTHTHVLIHGHTHRPAHHIDNHTHRWVLSDWDLEDATHRKRGGYLRLDEKGIEAISVY